MKSGRIAVIAVFLFLSIQNSCKAWAQNGAARGSRHEGTADSTQPAQVVVVSPQLTDFERYSSAADQPLITLNFSPITLDLGPGISLTLTPVALSPFDAPNALKALAVELRLSQSPLPAHNTDVAQLHSVATLLDFDELARYTSFFTSLAATGMPRPAFADARTVVHMASRSGMRLELSLTPDGRALCVVSTGVDSVAVSLDSDSAKKLADAFAAAQQTLDSARESKT
jgi:hypothetical protein